MLDLFFLFKSLNVVQISLHDPFRYPFNNPVFSLLIHHCMVWILNRNTTDSKVGRKTSLVPTCLRFRISSNPESRNEQLASNPGYNLSQILPSGRCRALYTKTSRHLYSFFSTDEHSMSVLKHPSYLLLNQITHCFVCEYILTIYK